jgi:hypothetical protein
MKKVNRVIYVLLFIVIIVLLWRSCESERDRSKLISQLGDYRLKEKVFNVERLKDSSTLATQSQTILSQKEAIELGLLELEKSMKEVQSQVKQKSTTTIIEKQVPFIPDGYVDTIGIVRGDNGEVVRRDSIAVPTRFKLNEKWFNVDGLVKKDGLVIDSLTIPNKTIVTVGYKKAGFLNLSKDAVVQVKNENPYVNVTGLDNIVIKKKKKIWQNPLVHIGVGVVLGYYITK